MSDDRWRECTDPEELAAAVADGVEVQVVDKVTGRRRRTANRTERTFGIDVANGWRFFVPRWWRMAGEELVDAVAAVLDVQAAEIIPEPGESPADYWRRRARAVLAAFPPQPAPSPVPPWPGAVLSGLTDEDGVPTWLAQAGQVRGEQVRSWHGSGWVAATHSRYVWVEVRAPRAVPEPETERVPWWEAVEGDRDVTVAQGGPTFSAWLRLRDPEGDWWLVVNGCTDLATAYKQKIAPDGTVEVLKDGES